jgi:hypothetical protein
VSDLLGNLVSKTLNLASTIAPRPLSRFEPWQAAGALESVRLDSAVDVEAQSVAAPKPSSNDSLLMDRGREANDRPRRPIERSQPDSIDPVRSPAVSERIEQVIIERDHVERVEPVRSMRDSNVRPVVIPPVIASAIPRAAEPPPTVIERVERLIVDRPDQPQIEIRPAHDALSQQPMTVVPGVDPDRTRPVRAIETVGQPHTDRASDAPSVVVRSISAPPSPNASSDERPSPLRPIPLVERMPVTVAAERNLRSDNAPVRPPAPPTIHVSIGRVEVRATLPPAPVKRTAASTSAPSLDDYLRRRRAGDRR